MRRSGAKASAGRVFALALTWDGARWPKRTLPPKARDFLKIKSGQSQGSAAPSARKLAELFADDQVSEVRICWAPCLKGGEEVLSEPFETPAGNRIGFESAKTVRFGDVLGVIYRRSR